MTEGRSQSTLKTTFYDAENNKMIDTEDSIIIHDIQDGKMTYERKDADKNGYLYIDDVLVYTNMATVDKVGEKDYSQSNPFQFKKIGENYIYFTYSGSTNTGSTQTGIISSYSVNFN
jgi:hypothetical protein